MTRLKNKIAKGILLGSLVLLPSFGLSQNKLKSTFPDRYSSVMSLDKSETPKFWRGFSREEVPVNLRFELLSEYSNIENFKSNYNLKIQGTMQKSFPHGNFEPYLGAGMVYTNYNPNNLKLNTVFVGGLDIKLKNNSKFYFQASKEFKREPCFWFGLVKKL